MNNKYEIRGEVTAIFLKYKGKTYETIIDTADLKRVDEFPNTWFIHQFVEDKPKYIKGFFYQNEYHKKSIGLHRWILEPEEDFVIDHINHDTLNNRRSNIRVVTVFENQQNRLGAQRNSLSGIRGVCWKTKNKKWESKIKINGKTTYLGMFNDIKEAESFVVEARKKFMPYSKEASS